MHDGEGWYRRSPKNDGLFHDFIGTFHARAEGAKTGRVRFASTGAIGNHSGGVHGGFLLALVDQAIFNGPTVCGYPLHRGATIEVTSQFLAPVLQGPDIDAVTEVLRETGRMLFVRGVLEQEGEAKLAFTGTLRKL